MGLNLCWRRDIILDYDESQEPFTSNDVDVVDYYYKSMIAAIVVAVVVGVILLVLVALYLKRNITYKAIISGRGNRAEMGRTNKVNFNERKLISTKKILKIFFLRSLMALYCPG